MSLLTKEQQKDIADIREINRLRHDLATGGEATKDVGKLLSIFDDLQARAPKQYTVQELREWFKNRPLIQDDIDALLHEFVPGQDDAWYGILKFASHVGALKAEP